MWTKATVLGWMLCVTWSTMAAQESTCATGSHTLYSQHAVSLDNGFERLTSPDGLKTLSIRVIQNEKSPDGSEVLFTVFVDGREFKAKLQGFNAEVLWSPDSAAFAVTETEGGGGIGYRAYVFFVGKDGIRKIDVSAPVERAFHVPGRCLPTIPPNIAIVGWLDSSDHILVAAEVVPMSACSCAGAYVTYEVSLPAGTIGRMYSQLESKNRFWNLLGCELRGARSCVEK